VKYLLIGPAKPIPGKKEWIFPKGHIWRGEWHGETALREVLEETGIVAELIYFVKSVKFQTEKEAVYVKFYLMKELFKHTQESGGSTTPLQNEKKREPPVWCSFDEALSKLTYIESQYILKEAEKRRIIIESSQNGDG
ncbi:MAG: NUDIX domain-containing protein, partial [Methanomicrobiales archaeon]|nr:NUDIX domain-containing protein [Methanomicrobiales archaeon]